MTPEQLEVLLHAYRHGFSLQSNYARENAQIVAALASLGFLTTREGEREFGKTWRPTFAGLLQLSQRNIV